MVKILLENAATVDTQNNEGDSNGRSALMFACREGHTEAAKVLVENAAQLNLQKEEWGSPLMLACKEGYSGVIKLLLEKGAQADLKDALVKEISWKWPNYY